MSKLKQFLLALIVLWTLGIVAYSFLNNPISDLRNIRLEQLFALSGLFFLYTSVLANPIYTLFGKHQWAQEYKSIQKILIGATLVYGLIHASIAFFLLLGGFSGLAFLNSKFITAIALAMTALSLLIFCAITFGKKDWYRKIVYLIGVFITIHALLLGSHFLILSALIPRIFFIALGVLILFLAAALDKWMRSKNWPLPFYGINLVIAVIIVSMLGYYYFNPKTQLPSASVHSGHVMTNIANDHTVMMTASPANPKPGETVRLTLEVRNSKGQVVNNFDIIHDALMHLVIVNDKLDFFNHVHPELKDGVFTIDTIFPQDGQYHLYADFLPTGGYEQQIPLMLSVGDGVHRSPTQTLDTNLVKTTAKYQVAVTVEPQLVSFELKDAKTQTPITNLQPYMGAYGHLVMINQETYQYLHIHPILKENGSGPRIDFMPAIPLPFGVWRTFGQFKDSDGVFVIDFTLKID